MADFSKIRALSIKDGATAEYTFFDLPGQPKVKVKPATKHNPDFIEALASDDDLRQIPTDIDVKISKKLNEKMAKLYGGLIVSWSNMHEYADDDSGELLCDDKNKTDFMLALIDVNRSFSLDFINFCMNENNFVSFDVKKKAKN